jgi:hypothetical protein
MRRAAKVTAVLGAVLLAVGCSDSEQPDPLAPEISAAAAATAEQDAEKAALDELTRLVALAMNDQGLRQRVKNDMRASRHTIEHKLPFSDYLHGNSGGILLAKMAKESGKSRDEILALLEQVRPLEFYMPVPEHRESWTGGSDLWIGSLLEDHTVPTVFTTSGQRISLTAEEIPTTPAIALVPVETNFTATLSAVGFVNTNDQSGEAIGTYQPRSRSNSGSGETCLQPPCDGDDGSSGGGGAGINWSNLPTGLYLTKIDIPDDYEGPFKGSPEFETHLQAPNTDPAKAADLRCAGALAPDPRSVYDQNGRGFTGAILVADSFEMARFQARYGTSVGMSIISWEDDDGACEIRVEQDRFKKMTDAVAAAYPGVHAAIQAFGSRVGRFAQRISPPFPPKLLETSLRGLGLGQDTIQLSSFMDQPQRQG